MRLIYIILCLSISSTLYSQGAGLTINKLNTEKNIPLHVLLTKYEEFRPYRIHKPPLSGTYSFSNPFRYKDELGFFCKVELKWDKMLYRPLRFRLGSYDYVNRLEGK